MSQSVPVAALDAIQQHLRDERLDGWLVHDFRNNNATLARVLPPPPEVARRHVTRRLFLYVPAVGRPELVTSHIDARAFAGALDADVALGPGVHETFLGWPEYRAALERRVRGRRVAMEYSPGCELPTVAVVDAGTLELVRALGAEVVSSADLIQFTAARWSDDAQGQHAFACRQVDEVKDAAFARIAQAHREGRKVHEHEIAEEIRHDFTRRGLEWPDGPIVAVDEHAADPHYEPSPRHPRAILPGAWVLIDLWARVPGEAQVHADVTWTGYCGRTVPARHREVFDAVLAARDAALALAQDAWRAGRPVRGWELDQAARGVLVARGFARGLRHRTGHSLSPGPLVHGSGMNLDDLETHDTRRMLPGTGFTIEPGVYLPEERLGVRNEIDVFVDPQRGPVVTSRAQDEPLLVI